MRRARWKREKDRLRGTRGAPGVRRSSTHDCTRGVVRAGVGGRRMACTALSAGAPLVLPVGPRPLVRTLASGLSVDESVGAAALGGPSPGQIISHKDLHPTDRWTVGAGLCARPSSWPPLSLASLDSSPRGGAKKCTAHLNLPPPLGEVPQCAHWGGEGQPKILPH